MYLYTRSTSMFHVIKKCIVNDSLTNPTWNGCKRWTRTKTFFFGCAFVESVLPQVDGLIVASFLFLFLSSFFSCSVTVFVVVWFNFNSVYHVSHVILCLLTLVCLWTFRYTFWVQLILFGTLYWFFTNFFFGLCWYGIERIKTTKTTTTLHITN